MKFRKMTVMGIAGFSFFFAGAVMAEAQCMNQCREEFEDILWHRFSDVGVFTDPGDGGIVHSFWAQGSCHGVHDSCIPEEEQEEQEEQLLALSMGADPDGILHSFQTSNAELRVVEHEGILWLRLLRCHEPMDVPVGAVVAARILEASFRDGPPRSSGYSVFSW